MGILRVALALCVVVWHIDDKYPVPINGYLAVTCFYVISGFYMSLVIRDDAGRPGWVRRFYLKRFYRLFPVYWTVLLAALLASIALAGPVDALDLDKPVSMWLPAWLANITIFGLNWLVMAEVVIWNEGVVRLVGPAWSLAIELEFYLVAPFILTRSVKVVAAVFVACLAVRLTLLGLPYDPWRYFFSPSVWCFFFLGALAHRLLWPIPREVVAQFGSIAVAALVGAVVICGTYEIKDIDGPELWLFYIVLAAAVPPIFALTEYSALDRAIGNLSYPIYIVHRPLLIAMAQAAGVKHFADLHWSWHVAGFLLSIAAAVIVHKLVETHTERWREQVKRAAPAAAE